MKKIKGLFLSMDSYLLLNPVNFFPDDPSIEINTESYDNFNYSSNSSKYDIILFDDASMNEDEIQKYLTLTSRMDNCGRIIYTGRREHTYIRNLAKSGVEGIISKRAPLEKVKDAIVNVFNGRKYYCDFILKWILSDDIKINLTSNEFRLLKLTVREKEILSLIAQGLKNKDIGKKLFTSPRTIETHKRNMIKKLQFKTTVELTSFAALFH